MTFGKANAIETKKQLYQGMDPNLSVSWWRLQKIYYLAKLLPKN